MRRQVEALKHQAQQPAPPAEQLDWLELLPLLHALDGSPPPPPDDGPDPVEERIAAALEAQADSARAKALPYGRKELPSLPPPDRDQV